MSTLATRCHSFIPLAPQLTWTQYNHHRIYVNFVEMLWLFTAENFKGILKHFTAMEFPVMSLRRSTCCTRHRAWKSAHQASTCAHTGSPAPAFMGMSLGQKHSPLLPLIGSKMQFSSSAQRWTGDCPLLKDEKGGSLDYQSKIICYSVM